MNEVRPGLTYLHEHYFLQDVSDAMNRRTQEGYTLIQFDPFTVRGVEFESVYFSALWAKHEGVDENAEDDDENEPGAIAMTG